MLWWGLAYIFVKMLAVIAELEADIIQERTLAFLLPGRRASPPSSFSISPPSNHATMSKY
ncbi:hypothetical protein [Aneurinibacillus migulanus]|uniref:hypothetical protein n=1 Tax=Aneurinibacillus migulanus TaxID=47500 RepID=UPI001269D1FF|nr:hypothetical protein [Aneurinibacillus migulanus]